MCILLVEDDYNDILLIQRAFRKAEIRQPMMQVSDGEEAIAYLSREGKYADKNIYPTPLLVLLDLKLPRRSGLEVLAWIRQHPRLKRLLVVVLSSSKENSDLNHAYDLGINSYLVKPVNFQDFVKLIQLVEAYWLQRNEPPKISCNN
ncbi:response regulator [Crocosphaera chwakensis]|uniref:Response regulator n=1 Tax=Crocosphaera chwakensis CCY0110 TaxID=391612 RepID=A3ITQ1_9CHRO|nr:response regulator [Crocosphaera chwakensis]EAZ90117.1 response regulator [Crocosphaera chwakensis CCY0110]